jgi:hypothetical protein
MPQQQYLSWLASCYLMLAEETEKWAKVIRTANIKAE